jgi:hypothetical protein
LSYLLLGRTEEATVDLDRVAVQSPELRSSRELLERAVEEHQSRLKKEATGIDENLPWLKKLAFRLGPRSRTDEGSETRP